MFSKKIIFVIAFVSIAIISIAGYLYFSKQQLALAQTVNYHYIRPNGGNYGLENGSDWNNAFDGMPATFVRGDIYYVAGGNYTNKIIFNTPNNGAAYIYIKKASSSCCSSVAGWDSSFETTQAVFTGDTAFNTAWQFTSSYWDVDGVTGSGTSGYGFLIKAATITPSQNGEWLINGTTTPTDHVSIQHTEIQGLGSAYNISQEGVRGGQYDTYWTIKNNYFHESGHMINIPRPTNTNWEISNNYFKHNWGSSSQHGAGLRFSCSSNLTFSNNVFDDIMNGTAVIESMGTWVDTGIGEHCTAKNIKIYNNVFVNNNYTGGNGLIATSNGACSNPIDTIFVYNNTFVNSNKRIFVFPIRTNYPSDSTEPTWPTASGAVVVGNIQGRLRWKEFGTPVGGEATWQPSTTYVSGNIVVPTTGNGHKYLAYACDNNTPVVTNAIIKNNLVYNASGCVQTMNGSYCDTTSSYATVDYNYYNTATAIPEQTHKIISSESAPIIFNDYTRGDYRLTLNSQAVNTGVTLVSPYDLDFNGVARPQGSAWDIGAYEYISTPPPPPPRKGDFNLDDKVNDLDFTDFKNAFKSIFNSLFDLNSDSTIDVKDLGVLMNSWLP